MFRKFIFMLLSLTIVITTIFTSSLQTIAATTPVGVVEPTETLVQTEDVHPENQEAFDLSRWLIVDETSVWTTEEMGVVEQALRNTFGALEEAHMDGETLLDGYRFRRYDGEFANDKEGKIALANHTDQEIVLSDSIFLPENEFYIYHELGHVVDHRSGRALNDQFHALTLQIEGVTALHDWTTAQGFFLRGQAHVNKLEGTADAFAVWVFVGYVGNPVPQFNHMPENANPKAIVEVFGQALETAFGTGL